MWDDAKRVGCGLLLHARAGAGADRVQGDGPSVHPPVGVDPRREALASSPPLAKTCCGAVESCGQRLPREGEAEFPCRRAVAETAYDLQRGGVHTVWRFVRRGFWPRHRDFLLLLLRAYRKRWPTHRQSCAVAKRAPSAIAWNLAHTTVGWTSGLLYRTHPARCYEINS